MVLPSSEWIWKGCRLGWQLSHAPLETEVSDYTPIWLLINYILSYLNINYYIKYYKLEPPNQEAGCNVTPHSIVVVKFHSRSCRGSWTLKQIKKPHLDTKNSWMKKNLWLSQGANGSVMIKPADPIRGWASSDPESTLMGGRFRTPQYLNGFFKPIGDCCIYFLLC